MDERKSNNYAELCGTLAQRPTFSHESRGERFYTFPLETKRLSGTADLINIIARESILQQSEPEDWPKIHILGELRSFNNKRGEGSKLVISVFAREMQFDDCEDLNEILLTGTICKQPNLRTTPMGRDICDFMLAVNRRYGRSDYLPCIAWGARAKEVAGWPVGTVVDLSGRIQSRQYIKIIDGEPVEKTAFEVSVVEIQRAAPLPSDL